MKNHNQHYEKKYVHAQDVLHHQSLYIQVKHNQIPGVHDKAIPITSLLVSTYSQLTPCTHMPSPAEAKKKVCLTTPTIKIPTNIGD